ncbi:MAG: DUF2946 family protein [Sphingomonas sp.]
MRILRRLALRYQKVAALLLAAALAIRIIVPAGFMPTQTAAGIEIAICSGQGPMQIVIGSDGVPRPADHHEGSDVSGHCAFAATGLAMLSPIAPDLHLASVAFAMVRALAPKVVPSIVDQTRRRPPLRAPPLSW